MHKGKLIIIISGKKGSGKNYLANCYASHFIEAANPNVDVDLDEDGHLSIASNGGPYEHAVLHGPRPTEHAGIYGVRVLSFADQLKFFCTSVLGLRHESCWGTDEDKDALTHIKWESMPLWIRIKYAKKKWWKPFSWISRGPMSGRRVMQVFGTDIVREMFADAWAFASINLAMSLPHRLVIFCDGRFPNEIGIKKKVCLNGHCVKTTRLLRKIAYDAHPSENALDHMPPEAFDRVCASNVTRGQVWNIAKADLAVWLLEAGITDISMRDSKIH